MDVVSICPFRAASLLWQPKAGGYVLTVVCKATFRLLPFESQLMDQQEQPNESDKYWNDDGERSLYSPSDLAPFKPRADVLLVGYAFSPRKEPVRSLTARLIVGEVNKAIEVFGERAWTPDGRLRDGARFTKTQLRYEHAAGGPDTSNPVGMRPRATDSYGSVAIPHLQPVGLTPTDRETIIEPIGFGPIASTWPTRVAKLGRHAASWSSATFMKQPLPEGFDPSFFNAAPADQQLDALHDNERIILENLDPEHPRLVTSLPGVHPRVFVERRRASPEDLTMVCDTLWIDNDRAICTLTWRGQVPLESARQTGRVIIAMERAGQRLAWSDVERQSGRSSFVRKAELNPFDDAPRSAGRTTLSGISPAPLRRAGEDDSGATSEPPRLREQTGRLMRTTQSGTDAYRPILPAASKLPTFEGGLYGEVSLPRSPPPREDPDRSSDGLSDEISPNGYAPSKIAVSALSRGSADARGSVETKPARDASSSWLPPPLKPASPARGTARPPPMVSRSVSGSILPPPLTPSGGLPVQTSSASSSTWTSVRSPARDVIQLLWFDAASVPKIREVERWKPLLDELKARESRGSRGDELRFKEAPEVRDRREVFSILTRAEPCDPEGVNEALRGSISEDGELAVPLLVFAGTLQLPFDELETTRALVAAATPLAGTDKKLKETLDAVSEILRTPGLQSSLGVAEGLTARVKEAFNQANRTLPATYLDTSVERMLLDQRHYQKRMIFGRPFIRALLLHPLATAPIPTYLPESLSTELPMFQSMKVRVLVEAHPAVDQYEAHSTALRAIAIGRVVLIEGRR